MESGSFDVLVIGAGHAGCEAALAAARMGLRTALVTGAREAIARMSCNPAIGGLAKGQLVRELDALGGAMGRVTDDAGIQFRLLNRSKGPAVQSPRAQCDRRRYSDTMRQIVESTPLLEIVEGLVGRIQVERAEAPGYASAAAGIVTEDGRELRARAIVLTPGTFMRGLMHVGDEKREGGRFGEAPARRISENLAALGFTLGRLKTGTPPRLDAHTIDFSNLAVQPGDDPPVPFSFDTERIGRPQVLCHLTHTTHETHRIVRENAHRAPMFSGAIQGTGPRYCPSLEDKVMRFPEVESHRIYLEPEGAGTDEIYPNGISTSIPADVQEAFVRTIPGLANVRITRYGYAVEYDFAPTHQIHPTLETKRVEGLYFAGQICGTSGYEEAAVQGFVAGVNAALKLSGKDPFVLDRSEAYIGVLVDDLVTKEIKEPYRMFTSQAEYRLLLRQDNADRRLRRHGYRLGLVSKPTYDKTLDKERLIQEALALLRRRHADGVPLDQIVRRPGMTLAEVWPRDLPALAADVAQQVEIECKYAGYVERQAKQVERFKEAEGKRIPSDLDYLAIQELSAEARSKLALVRPASLGQATRLAGVSPADIGVLRVHLKKRSG